MSRYEIELRHESQIWPDRSSNISGTENVVQEGPT